MSDQPTIVLVHGAFAESSAWNAVTARLQAAGHRVIAFANPLRSLSGDAEALRSLLTSIEGPVVLVGHSYGGAVASNAALGLPGVRALVFVAAFAPEPGESIGALTGKFPGSTLPDVLELVPQADGTSDIYIRQDAFHQQFAADLPVETATLDAAAQRPLRDTALNEPSGEPAWRAVPSWFVFPELDRNIPLEAHHFMAERAGAKATVVVPGASHALPASAPEAVATTILDAVAGIG
ncbi:alpha/beta fold hydrolase [Streptomyces sp. NPDC002328]|uniref:alpha/beta fold hydrolase n=1 Tax=Streptomyces sp. NPDC002328 TaxID=3364642 RepID=UPI0036C72865